MAPVLTAANAIAITGLVKPEVKEIEKECRAQLVKKYRSVRSVGDELLSLCEEIAAVTSWVDKLKKLKSPSVEMLHWCRKAMELYYRVDHCKYQYICEKGRFSTRFYQSNIVKCLKKELKKIIAVYGSHKWDQDTSDLYDGLDCRPSSVFIQGITAPQPQCSDLINLLHWDPQIEENNLRVISIVGPGGSGKTSLAVSALSSTASLFDICATVCVSSSHSLTSLLMEIWTQVTQKELSPSMPHEDQLIQKIYEFLATKRFLILLDDILNEDMWEILKVSFPCNRLGSRVLLTTRVDSPALSCPERNEFIFRMLPLDDGSSIALFLNTIYGTNRCPKEFEGHMRDILKKCGGIPLLILKIASHILRHGHMRMEAWDAMSAEVNCFLEFPESSPLQDLHRELSLSYIFLPWHQKNCVLFLSGLPQDSNTDIDVAISSWIAEEFVSTRSEAETCLNRLLSYHLVEAVHTSADGRVLSVRVPKLIHDMLGKISYDSAFFAAPPFTVPGLKERRINRLSLLSANVQFSTSCNKMHQIRSVILHSSIALPFDKCKYLRVLVVHMCHSFTTKDLEIVATLAYLKVLVLNTPQIRKLPRQTANLRRLEALVMDNSVLRRMPNLSRFRSLTCLKVGVVALPAGIGMLTRLEKLEVFDVDGSQREALSELGHLHSLKVLSCFCNSDFDIMDDLRHIFFVAAIRELLTDGNLEELMFSGESMQLQFLSFFKVDTSVLPANPTLRKFHMQNRLYMCCFPVFLKSFSKLSDISINLENLKPADIEALGNFASLKRLVLCIKSGPAIVEFSGRLFQQLQDLAIESSLLELRFKAGCLKKLSELHLSISSGLQLFDLHAVSYLKTVHLSLSEASADAADNIVSAVSEAAANCNVRVVVNETHRTQTDTFFGEDGS